MVEGGNVVSCCDDCASVVRKSRLIMLTSLHLVARGETPWVRCNSHCIVPAKGASFIPRKPRKGRKLGKNHRGSVFRAASFVKFARRKAPTGAAYIAVSDGRPIFRERRRFIYALDVDQTIYDSNDPGRNNWNGNERKERSYDLSYRSLPAVRSSRRVKYLTRKGIMQDVYPFKPVDLIPSSYLRDSGRKRWQNGKISRTVFQ